MKTTGTKRRVLVEVVLFTIFTTAMHGTLTVEASTCNLDADHDGNCIQFGYMKRAPVGGGALVTLGLGICSWDKPCAWYSSWRPDFCSSSKYDIYNLKAYGGEDYIKHVNYYQNCGAYSGYYYYLYASIPSMYNGADYNIYGAGGKDTIYVCESQTCYYYFSGADDITVYGDDANDTIHGSPVRDTIYGGINYDKIYGYAGDDLIYGDYGNDTIEGGIGDDTLYGDTSVTSEHDCYGFVCDDWIFGGTGSDYIRGGPGRDCLFGNEHNDSVLGDEGVCNYVDGGGGYGDVCYCQYVGSSGQYTADCDGNIYNCTEDGCSGCIL